MKKFEVNKSSAIIAATFVTLVASHSALAASGSYTAAGNNLSAVVINAYSGATGQMIQACGTFYKGSAARVSTKSFYHNTWFNVTDDWNCSN